ncbi:unnamed protein product [Meganyctiphanes norvegica]|uniref:Kazal-like domain-containing protein n=1 Tax=Meganyctiphanes norvegica TaxID=48144 RepID=A0AAV2R5Q5_MEGNR
MNRVMISLVFCLAAAAALGVVSSEGEFKDPREQACLQNCITTADYSPVCGSDGVTYDNEAKLKCAADCTVGVIQMVHPGKCRPIECIGQCPVPLIHEPLCGTDGRQYANKIDLKCYNQCHGTGVREAHSGNCATCESGECFTTFEYKPVCGTDGVTYSNMGVVHCQQRCYPDLSVAHLDRCGQCNLNKTCRILKIYLPLCGDDGKTYQNPSHLACQRKCTPDLSIAHFGRCIGDDNEPNLPMLRG